jgi:hypothetical protein
VEVVEQPLRGGRYGIAAMDVVGGGAIRATQVLRVLLEPREV